MSLPEDLHPASYKGASFLVTSSRVNGGRKDVKHSFPNSDRQYIEDLGLSPRVFALTAFISAGSDGEDYLPNRNQLIRVLEEGGTGKLVHPLYGDLNNIVARSFTVIEDFGAIGECRFEITFEVSDVDGEPVQAENTLSEISEKATALNTAINTDIASNFSVTNKFANSFTDAVSKVNGAINAIKDKAAVIQGVADQIDSFTYQINDTLANVTSLVQIPQNLADSFSNIFTSLGNLWPTVRATFDAIVGLFPFGDDDIVREETTPSRIERNHNDALINSAVQGLALSTAYVNAAQISFETVAEIESISDQLDAQFRKLVAADGFSTDTRDALIDLRVQTQAFFEAQKLNARQIIDIKTNLTSARLLAYQYYGDSTDGETLADLNSHKDDPTFLDGNIQVFSS